MYALLTRWLTPEESSVYLPLIKVGVTLGFAVGSLISGFFHWRATFYLVGFIGVAWSLLWALLVSSDPRDHNLVQPAELRYIQRSRNVRRSTAIALPSDPEDGLANASKVGEQESSKKKRKGAPWVRILTNPNVLIFIVVKFTVKMSTDTQTIQLPMYLDRVFRVSKELVSNFQIFNRSVIAKSSLSNSTPLFRMALLMAQTTLFKQV